MPSRLRALAALSLLAAGAGLSALACTTDFTVGKGAAATDAAAPQDAASDEGAAPVTDAGGPSCTAIAAALGVQLNAAITCPMAGALCVGRVTDECGCTRGTNDETNPAVVRYLSLRDQAVDAGCTEACRACPTPPTFLCTEADGGGPATCADPTAGAF